MHRNEIKYYTSNLKAMELRLFLKQNMDPDPHSDETGSYRVRSLYFDTQDNKDYYEKIIGHNIRKKIRLRIYDISTDVVKLELKSKYGSYTHKGTVLIAREDAYKVMLGDCSPLLNYSGYTANKVFALMHRNLYRPTVIIDYDREAYFYPFQNIRLTIDKNLCAKFTHGSYDLFKNDICTIPLFSSYISILEVKYDHMIPVFLQRVLSNFEAQRTQISKYCLARNILGK